jgi:hypothetical protein
MKFAVAIASMLAVAMLAPGVGLAQTIDKPGPLVNRPSGPPPKTATGAVNLGAPPAAQGGPQTPQAKRGDQLISTTRSNIKHQN